MYSGLLLLPGWVELCVLWTIITSWVGGAVCTLDYYYFLGGRSCVYSGLLLLPGWAELCVLWTIITSWVGGAVCTLDYYYFLGGRSCVYSGLLLLPGWAELCVLWTIITSWVGGAVTCIISAAHVLYTGTYMLTTGLIPALEKSSSARVV